MKILLTNDDGYFAPGITALYKALTEAGHQVIIVAPAEEKSATSHSLTIFNPLRVREQGPNIYSVNGFPADCVILAVKELFPDGFDLVISGINGGPNMGEDIFYSGTISATVEAMFLGCKAMAVSLDQYADHHWDAAARRFAELLDNNLMAAIPDNGVLNVNLPNLPYDDYKGVVVAAPGHRDYRDFVFKQIDPRGRAFYWIGGLAPSWENLPGSDSLGVSQGNVVLTPLKPDYYHADGLPQVQSWLEEYNKK